MPEPFLKDLLSWGLALVVLGAAFRMVFHKNVMHSAVYFAVSLVGTAGLFFLMTAEFVGIAQLLVYAGAVVVLILIAVMASTKSYRQFELTSFLQTGGAAAGVLVLTAFMVYIALSTAWETSGLKPYTPVRGGDIAHIGQGILIDYVLAFELASFVLLGALIGAIVLVRPEPANEENR
ncbi:MAG: NADH-quinone oxidoreductase subunit J [Nitrospirae bacterium]|nr:NADH-quinone oxidoreductase subunit J [Nitrospirota bacterium]